MVHSMRETIVPEEWQFQTEVVCFNCKAKAPQVLRIKDGQASVVCTACQASRLYVIRSVIYGTDTPPIAPLGRRYEPWEFAKTAVCLHCHEQSAQSIHLDEYKMNVVCKECGFTRIFKFDHLDFL